MNSDTNTNRPRLAARLKMAVAALALAGVLAGGASAIVEVDPVTSEDTTETARRSAKFETIKFDRGGWASARGVSWQ